MDDLISRQDAIDACHRDYDNILYFTSDGKAMADSFEYILNALPSAQPQRMHGRWIHDGSKWSNRWIYDKCGWKIFTAKTNFCPKCGHDMRKESNG